MIQKEMDRYTDMYVDAVMEQLFAMRAQDPDTKLFIEQRLDFSQWVPGGFGTGDAIIVSNKGLIVNDLKYGTGVPVSAVENPQARLYGLGAIQTFGALYDFGTIKNRIIQPRLDSISEEVLTRDELLAWGESIKPTAQLAWEGKGEYKTGPWCQFCSAKAVCAKRVSEALSVVRHVFDVPGAIPDEDIPSILSIVGTAAKWCEDFKAYAKAKALRGDQIKGYKLVRGRRGRRSFTDEEKVREQLNRAGFGNEAIERHDLLSPNDLEKLVGKKAFGALVGAYVTQPAGPVELVPETDTRPGYTDPDTDFADLVANNTEQEETT